MGGFGIKFPCGGVEDGAAVVEAGDVAVFSSLEFDEEDLVRRGWCLGYSWGSRGNTKFRNESRKEEYQ